MRRPIRSSIRPPRPLALAARAGAPFAVAFALALALAAGGGPGGRAPTARAAGPSSPVPGVPSAVPDGGDTRSPGEGAGLAGAPFVAVGTVVAVGLASGLATLVYVRLTGGTAADRR